MNYSNNNKKIIGKIVFRSLKVNRQRNIFAVMGIILTSVLLSAVIAMSASLMATMERYSLHDVGTMAHGGYKQLTIEEFNTLRTHEEIKAYGKTIYVGEVGNQTLNGYTGVLLTMDEQAAEWGFSEPDEGTLPIKKNEIMLPKWILSELDEDAVIGDTVEIEYQLQGEKKIESFVLSGLYMGKRSLSKPAMLVVSESYAEDVLAEPKLDMLVMFDKPVNIDLKLQTIADDKGIEMNDKRYGSNRAYLNTKKYDPEVLIPALFIILLIIISGYLLIYNIFYIAIIKDIHFYGMLKTVGMTMKQIKKVVLRQGVILSFIGIPIGLVIGSIIGHRILPLAISTSNIDMTDLVIVSDYRIFLISAAFSLITVYISCKKPAKIAGKVSPIEALRYTGAKEAKKKGIKKSKSGMKIHRMAFTNIFRKKKRGIIVLASMSTSIILFLMVFKFIQSFSMEDYLANEIQSDFVLAQAGYYSHDYHGEESISSDIYERLLINPNVQAVDKINVQITNSLISKEKLNQVIEEKIKLSSDSRYIEYLASLDKINVQLYGYSDSIIDKVRKNKVIDGEIDLDKLKTGDYILVQPNDYYGIGEQIEITLPNGSTKDFEVMALVDYYYANDIRYSIGGGYKAYLPVEVFEAYIDSPVIMQLQINATKNGFEQVNAELETLVEKDSKLAFRSTQDYKKEYENFVSMMRTIGYALSGTIGLIAILNLINTILTSIIVRKQEFAMLESVGMTKKQLMRMLVLEGFWYSLMTTIIVSIVGLPFIKWSIETFAKETFFVQYNSNILPTVITYMIILGICGVIPWVCYKTFGNGSIVERLRAIEG